MKSPKVTVGEGIRAGNIKIPCDREARRSSLNRAYKEPEGACSEDTCLEHNSKCKGPVAKPAVCARCGQDGGGGMCRLGDK